MVIMVDDRPYQITGTPDQSVRELADEICSQPGESDRRMVVGLWCNGQAVAQEGLGEVLDSPANRYERLDVQTVPAAALIRTALSQAIELLDDSAATRRRAADFLADGQKFPAMHEIQKFFDVWKQVQESMLVCAEARGANLDTLQINGLGLTDILNTVKTQLHELKAGLENSDYVVVGDILRYEFDEPMAQWATFLTHLRDVED